MGHAAVLGRLNLWIRAPGGLDTIEFAARLRRRKLVNEPGRVFFDNPENGRSFVKLCSLLMDEERQEAGLPVALHSIEQGIEEGLLEGRKVGCDRSRRNNGLVLGDPSMAIPLQIKPVFGMAYGARDNRLVEHLAPY
ncbi:hypothetical protein KO516_08110 [Citreicella sp. C3M06]|uniref:hypothetical protein n=1 Tax=Citreicella sp. C3M06 TaxID=2841564 RepID=UPI001C0A0996|nr:hypothetical protein [Citreicella sp. C3M06]MBU2960778.1 hypothetical protein [Citreicella sp. C3M06]